MNKRALYRLYVWRSQRTVFKEDNLFVFFIGKEDNFAPTILRLNWTLHVEVDISFPTNLYTSPIMMPKHHKNEINYSIRNRKVTGNDSYWPNPVWANTNHNKLTGFKIEK